MIYRVFVVEDHPVMLEAYAQVFDFDPDFEMCGTAGSVDDALDQLEEATCDLVVTDLSLPGRDGIDLVRELHDRRPELPVLVVTGHDEEAFARAAHRAGAAGFLIKQTLVDTLIPTIRRVFAERDGSQAA